MRNTKWLVLTVATLLGAGTGGVFSAQAEDAGAAGRPGRPQFIEKAKEKLGLSEDQIDQIKGELQADQETLKGLISRLHQARVALRQEIQSAQATEASVRAAASKVGAAQADFAVERFKLFTRINPILTAEQREKLKGLQAQLDEVIDTAVNRLGERLQAR